ncbi:MAG TPA: phosphoribosylanthranilate isomerase [Gammaproteobacteria bacterium]|nr:phosphoribosylanthranilate isomerase [Gammaproteobacteria bacterium]
MPRVRIKFCGLTRAEDAATAAQLGVDAIGVVFHPPSSRAVTLEQARAVIDALPAFVTVAALFLDPERGEVERVLKTLPIDLLQFHGDESPAFCESFDRPYIKALPMADDVDLNAAAHDYRRARALLLDAHARGESGGQGRTFAWRRMELPLPVVLAGGLGPDNVGRAIETVRPWAVDVSSGVESSPGIKNHERMTAFVAEVNRAAC